MAKAFNLLGNTVQKEEKKAVKKQVKKQTKSLLSLPTDIEASTKKQGRPKKVVEEIKVTKPTNNSKVKETKHISTPTKDKVVKSNLKTSNKKWHDLYTNPPENFRPIQLNVGIDKEFVTGYKLQCGINTNNAYLIDKFKKANNTIEWQYINGCTDLSKCDRRFPDCIHCDIYKLRQKELKKNVR